MSFLSTFANYKESSLRTKEANAMKDYRNKMTNISNAINQNAITTNTTLQIQQSARKAVHIRREGLSSLGASTVIAAAAGVRGNSVQSTLIDLQRNTSLVDAARSRDLDQFFAQAHQQRLGSSLSAVQNQDLTFIPKPNLGQMLFKDFMATAESIATGGMSSGSVSKAAVGFDVTQFSSGRSTVYNSSTGSGTARSSSFSGGETVRWN
jgi:hypothetical protein